MKMFDAEWHDAYYAGLLKCADRYKSITQRAIWLDIWTDSKMLVHANDLLKFIDYFKEKIVERYPVAKLRAWLGNIQGKLHVLGATNDDRERDWTRPLFRHLDFPGEDILAGLNLQGAQHNPYCHYVCREPDEGDYAYTENKGSYCQIEWTDDITCADEFASPEAIISQLGGIYRGTECVKVTGLNIVVEEVVPWPRNK